MDTQLDPGNQQEARQGPAVMLNGSDVVRCEGRLPTICPIKNRPKHGFFGWFQGGNDMRLTEKTFSTFL